MAGHNGQLAITIGEPRGSAERVTIHLTISFSGDPTDSSASAIDAIVIMIGGNWVVDDVQYYGSDGSNGFQPSLTGGPFSIYNPCFSNPGQGC
jgi:hypothetical protein